MTTAAPSRRRAVASVVAVAAVSAGLTWWLTRPPELPTPRQALSITLAPEHDVIDAALSPDGTVLVYSAVVEGQVSLFARRLGQFEATPLPGTEHAAQPFFSPDGQRVGFVTEGALRWVGVDGGVAREVAQIEGATAGAAWTEGNQIIYAPLDGRGLQVVSLPPTGAPPPGPQLDEGALTTLDPEEDEIAHGWPVVLPGGESVVYTVARRQRDPSLMWMSLTSDDRTALRPADGAAFYVDSGHIVFARRGEIFAMPVERSRDGLEIAGAVRPVVDRVAGAAFGYAGLGRSSLAVARSGRLVWTRVADGGADNQLVWVDQDGATTEIDGVDAPHETPRVSPDGRRVAAVVRTSTFNRDVWVHDTQTGERRQLTAETGDNHSPVWTPDGRRLAYASNREGPQYIYHQAATDPDDDARTLIYGDARTPGSWLPGGDGLFFHEVYPERGRDIWVWTADSGGMSSAALLIGTDANERSPIVSPDGAWLAYVSDVRQGDQVYVRAYPGTEDQRVSLAGGSEPVWSPDGATLYYRQGPSVYRTFRDEQGEWSVPRRAFSGRFVRDPGGNVPSYDIAPDGTRFVMLRPTHRTTAIETLVGWQADTFAPPPGPAEP